MQLPYFSNKAKYCYRIMFTLNLIFFGYFVFYFRRGSPTILIWHMNVKSRQGFLGPLRYPPPPKKKPTKNLRHDISSQKQI